MILPLLDSDAHHLVFDLNEVVEELLQTRFLKQQQVTVLVCFRRRLSHALLLEQAIVVSEVGAFHHKVEGDVEGLLIVSVWEVGLQVEDSLEVWVDRWVVEVDMQDNITLQNEVDCINDGYIQIAYYHLLGLLKSTRCHFCRVSFTSARVALATKSQDSYPERT